MSASTVAVNEPVSSMPSRRNVLNPDSENVTAYVPGRRFSMRYCPVPSVTAVRTFSISAGLVASTVTPGSTAPDASFTAPAMTACANARPGLSTNKATSATDFMVTRISTSPLDSRRRSPLYQCGAYSPVV